MKSLKCPHCKHKVFMQDNEKLIEYAGTRCIYCDNILLSWQEYMAHVKVASVKEWLKDYTIPVLKRFNFYKNSTI